MPLPIFKAIVRILLNMNLSLNQTLLTFLFYERENLDDWINCGNSSVRDYLPLIKKDAFTYTHSFGVDMNKGLLFPQDLPLENSVDSYLCFWLALLHWVSYFSFLCGLPSYCLSMVFDGILCNMDIVLSINPSSNVSVFRDFNIRHKDSLTYDDGTNRTGELCHNFSS